MGGVGAAGRSEEGLDDGCGRSRLMPSFFAMEKRKEGGSIAMEKRKERPLFSFSKPDFFDKNVRRG